MEKIKSNAEIIEDLRHELGEVGMARLAKYASLISLRTQFSTEEWGSLRGLVLQAEGDLLDEGEGPTVEGGEKAWLAEGKRVETAVGFDSLKEVAPGETVDIEQTPQVNFKCERLFVEPSCAGAFNLVDVRIGVRSQLATTTPIPCFAFGAKYEGSVMGQEIETQVCMVAQKVTLRVQNISGEKKRFLAVMFGPAFVF